MSQPRRRPGPRSLPQSAVTMVAKLPTDVDEIHLRERIAALWQDPGRWFEPLGNVHFARWVVLERKLDGGALRHPAFLTYEANVDGDAAQHVHDLATHLGDLCDRVWSAVPAYPPEGARTPAARERFLLSMMAPYAALHIGHPGIDVVTVRNDLEVRRELGALLDEDDAMGGALRALPVRAAHAEVVLRMRHRRPDLALGRVEDGVARFGKEKAVVLIGLCGAWLCTTVLDGHVAPFEWLLGFVAAPLAFVLLVILLLVLLSRIIPLFVEREARGEAKEPRVEALAQSERDDREMRLIFASERSFGQNALTHLSEPRPSAFRWALARVVFFAIELVARIEYVNGALGDITSIHFARWLWIDGGRQLLFFSNYDGTWESYLGEFTDKQSRWLSAVWSNTEGFPPTEGLFKPSSGAGREDQFKRWTRNREVLTPFWYAAYPTIGVRTVLDNAAIRAALREDAKLSEIRTWMTRI